MPQTNLDDFTRAYIEAALWSSTADDSPEQKREDPKHEGHFDSSFLDLGYTTLTKAAERQMVADCAKFQADNAEWLTADSCPSPHGSLDSQAGHDFWLTRNGHGAGFWDGDWAEPATTKLTNAAHAYGAVNLYYTRGRVAIR